MTPEELEEAGRLLKAARSDLRALEALAADPEQNNDTRRVLTFDERHLRAVLPLQGGAFSLLPADR